MIKTVELNLNGLCNLTCSFCPRAQDYPNTNVHMSEATIDKICDHLKEIPYNVEVHMSGRGEPTLHENFPMIIDKLTAVPNVVTHLTTNGKKWDKWADSLKKLDKIVYNVYTDDEEDFWEAKDKIKDFPVTTMYLKSKDGKNLVVWQKGEFTASNEFLITNRAGHIDWDVKILGEGYCFRPFEKIFINHNGEYVLCCEDWSDTPMSNVWDESIMEYYNYNEELQLVKEQLNKDERIGVCAQCSFPG